jgi:Ser/Thr protein kinase RdoA (MazF antagonist)
MRVNTTITPDTIRKVLKMWNVTPDRVSPISARGNTHWKAQRGRETFVLRMYGRRQTGLSIKYELDILWRLHEQGWPVAAAIDGVAQHDGSAFVLFPLLPGRPHLRENERQRRQRGRILAELHRELSALADLDQRIGWRQADEVVAESECRRGRWRTFAIGMTRPDMVDTIARHFESVHSRLYAAGASHFPVIVVHGDLIAQNLLFQRGRLSGILDFDSAHLDLRAADVACTRRSRDDEVARGYLDVSPLSDAEIGCLDDLWRASVLRYALQLLDRETITGEAVSELEWCVAQLEKTRPFQR